VFEHLHISGHVHGMIMEDLHTYLEDSNDLLKYLELCREGGKNLFLLTNSPWPFVDAGMRHVLRDQLSAADLDDWPALFDVVIVSARKPDWYTKRHLGFRRVDRQGKFLFEDVTELQRGHVYSGGCMQEFVKLTGWSGSDVIYMGDHIYSDLSKPNKFASWKTAAIIKELEHEITCQAQPRFEADYTEAKNINLLIEHLQAEAPVEEINHLKARRDAVRTRMKEHVNPHFGSVFRTHVGKSDFFQETLTYSDIYTSSVTNFLQYPLDWAFYPIREPMAHDISPIVHTPVPPFPRA